MSNICLQIGQCGNQLGKSFFNGLIKNKGEDNEIWFRPSDGGYTARSILVDTEPNVILRLLGDTQQWLYDKDNAVFCSGGSSNNWALGYTVNGPLLAESITERLRLECEKADFVRSIVTFLSAGGGTGSGVGTYIMEKLQDIIPRKYLISCVTLPQLSGASPVHLYNTILSLSHLNDSSNGIVTFYNEYLVNQCTQLYKDSDFNLDEINSIVAKQLCTLFHPYNGASLIPDYIQKLIPIPSLKLLSMKSFPYVKHLPQECLYEPLIPWKSVLTRLKSLLVTNSEHLWDNQNLTRTFSESKQNSKSYFRALSNIVMCRGEGAGSAQSYAQTFNSDVLYSRQSMTPSRFMYLFDNRPVYGQKQFSCVVTNSAIFINKLNDIADKSWNFYTKNAFIHHYEKYGLNEKELSISFLKIEHILKHYQSLEFI